MQERPFFELRDFRLPFDFGRYLTEHDIEKICEFL